MRSASSKASVSRRVQRSSAVRPVAALNTRQAAATLAVISSVVAVVAAPVRVDRTNERFS
jgi:hypothetical protein